MQRHITICGIPYTRQGVVTPIDAIVRATTGVTKRSQRLSRFSFTVTQPQRFHGRVTGSHSPDTHNKHAQGDGRRDLILMPETGVGGSTRPGIGRIGALVIVKGEGSTKLRITEPRLLNPRQLEKAWLREAKNYVTIAVLASGGDGRERG